MIVSGRRVLLTGASGGIGRAIARAFADRGAQLILSGRRVDVLESLAAELGAQTLAADLAEREAPARLVEAAAPVDILVANAAVPASGPLEEYGVDEIDRALDVNLRAPVLLARLLVGEMRHRGSGHLVFVGSLAGLAPSAMTSLYCATKFGLRGFALSLREELRGSGVGVSLVLPGFVREAGMFADSGVQLPPFVGTRSPEEVAATVVRAVERDLAEVSVAPAHVGLGARFATVAPTVAAALTRRLGADEVVRGMVEGQRHKR